MVALEVIGVEEQKNPTASLPPDCLPLPLVGRLRKQQAAPAGTVRRHDDPALAGAAWRVLQKCETQLLREVRDGFIVVVDHQGH
jgi:hypothetical protein